MVRTESDLDGYSMTRRYGDGTFVRITIQRTDSDAYPSGWRYALHYGALNSSIERPTLQDGTILRYDNAHEHTKGHELHRAPDPEPEQIEFPGIVDIYTQFWEQVPKPQPDE